MIGKNIYTERDSNSLSELYHTNTKLNRWNARAYANKIDTFYQLSQNSASGIQKPGKSYPWAPLIPLPRNSGKNGLTLEETISRRRSATEFNGEHISIEQLSFILRFSAGITEEGRALRAHPSGGALYPLELYVAALAVDDLECGLYHYGVYEHALAKIGSGKLREQLAEIFSAEHLIEASSVALIISGIFYRTAIKYGERGYRLMLLEAGHLGQNILLSATSQGVAAVPLGGFLDDDVNSMLGLDGIEETVIYPILLGSSGEIP
jgi:SagB-type dehydrogenase family enzyme